MAFLSGPNKILLADKRNNWKLKRAGSDDKPKNFDNKDKDNKRSNNNYINNNNSNLKGSILGNTLNSNSQTRDKDRKFSSKASNDKYLKSRENSNAMINMSSNLSSKLE